MSFVDQLAADLASEAQLPAAARALLQEFVVRQRALLERLGVDGTRALFETLYLRGARAAWERAVGTMGQDELLAILQATGQQFDEALAARQRAQSALRQLTDALGALAVRLALQAVLAAL